MAMLDSRLQLALCDEDEHLHPRKTDHERFPHQTWIFVEAALLVAAATVTVKPGFNLTASP